MERIEWRFAAGDGRYFMRLLTLIAALILLLLVPGNIFMWNSKRHETFFTLSLVLLGLLVILWAITVPMFARAARARYYVDDVGLHIEPGRTFKWTELKDVDVILWPWPPGKRVIKIAARNPMLSRTLAFEPGSVDEGELVAFCRSRLAP